MPSNLIWYMRYIRCPHVGVHRTRFVAHGGHGKLFVSELTAFVSLKAKVDCSVDRLSDVAHEPLPRRAGRGRELFLRHASLLQTLSELRLPAALFAVPLLALPQTPVKRAVLLAIGGGDEIGDPHVDADH